MSKSVVNLTIEKWFEDNRFQEIHRRMFDDLKFKLERITKQPVKIEMDHGLQRANVYIGNSIRMDVHL